MRHFLMGSIVKAFKHQFLAFTTLCKFRIISTEFIYFVTSIFSGVDRTEVGGGVTKESERRMVE